MTAAELAPGRRVALTPAANPNHLRKGLAGVVRSCEVYQPPKARDGTQTPARLWLVVDFPTCPHNGGKPFASYLWGEEVTLLERSRPGA